VSDAAKGRRRSITLRIIGGVLMIAAEGCVVLVLFGAHAFAWITLAAVLMVVGVLSWRYGWRLTR
jgi:uncharacterized membrane protein